MTKQTDSKILRQLVDGILSAHGVDDLGLSIRLCEAFKKFYDSPDPRATKDELLKGLMRGSTKADELQAIADEIHRRTTTRPVTQPWIDFVAFAWKEAKHGKTITLFLDWWLSDEWQRAHPPAKPDVWYVKWDMAFSSQVTSVRDAQDVAR